MLSSNLKKTVLDSAKDWKTVFKGMFFMEAFEYTISLVIMLSDR